MKRKIKFRGKDSNGEWVYGDLHLLCDAPHIHTAPSKFPYAGKRAFVDPETIGQFTGMHDKNGVEIYEGDLVHVEFDSPWGVQRYDGEIIFNKHSFDLKIHSVDGDKDPCESFTDDEDWKLEQLERLYNYFAI